MDEESTTSAKFRHIELSNINNNDYLNIHNIQEVESSHSRKSHLLEHTEQTPLHHQDSLQNQHAHLKKQQRYSHVPDLTFNTNRNVVTISKQYEIDNNNELQVQKNSEETFNTHSVIQPTISQKKLHIASHPKQKKKKIREFIKSPSLRELKLDKLKDLLDLSQNNSKLTMNESSSLVPGQNMILKSEAAKSNRVETLQMDRTINKSPLEIQRIVPQKETPRPTGAGESEINSDLKCIQASNTIVEIFNNQKEETSRYLNAADLGIENQSLDRNPTIELDSPSQQLKISSKSLVKQMQEANKQKLKGQISKP